jgi:hypothetical protein
MVQVKFDYEETLDVEFEPSARLKLDSLWVHGMFKFPMFPYEKSLCVERVKFVVENAVLFMSDLRI